MGLTNLAAEKKYSDFNQRAKEILSQKVAEKMGERSYFSRMDTARGLHEAVSEKEVLKRLEVDYQIDKNTLSALGYGNSLKNILAKGNWDGTVAHAAKIVKG